MSNFWNSQGFEILVRALVVITCLPIHELAHGFIAYKLGDPTAKNQGRLSFNPLRHLDPIGTVMILAVGFGYAKPVPVDPRYFKNPKKGMALTALAGPVSNFLLGFVLLLVLRIITAFVPMSLMAYEIIWEFFGILILTNVGLCVFNLLPVPPLDGSRIVDFFLPDRLSGRWHMLEQKYRRFIMLGLFVLIYFGVLRVPLQFLRNLLVELLFFLTGFVDIVAGLVY